MANAQRGRCNNFGNCTKADTGEIIDIVSGSVQLPICPECGQSLIPYNKGVRKGWWIILGIAAFVATGGAIVSYIISPPAPGERIVEQTVCSPLLMEGKKSLFQRVLVKPNSHKSMEVGALADQAITPFSRYYVYERQTNNNEEWLNIGSSSHCKKEGWIKAKETLEWKQQLSLTFTNTATKDRGRAYFFKDQEALQDVIKESAIIQENDPRLVAVEPENYVDPEKNFYLTPILDFSTQNDINLLKIATATLNPDTPSSAARQESSSPQKR